MPRMMRPAARRRPTVTPAVQAATRGHDQRRRSSCFPASGFQWMILRFLPVLPSLSSAMAFSGWRFYCATV